MSDVSKSQRGKMAAHLCDLAWIAFRNDDLGVADRVIDRVTMLTSEAGSEVIHYRNGLSIAGVAPEDIDAAVASCMREEHPAGSLPAMIAERRRLAIESADVERKKSGATATEALGRGIAWGCSEALRMLGVKP